MNLIETDYCYGQPKILTKSHLKQLLKLEQLKKRHGIIVSHLLLTELVENIVELCVKHMDDGHILSNKILMEIKMAEEGITHEDIYETNFPEVQQVS